jgi:hypothetical protein
MTLRLSSDKTPVGGAPPPGHAPDPSPPSLTHQSFGEATGSAMPSHGTAIPCLAQLSLNKMMEAISKAKTRKDIAKLSAIIGGSWKPQKHLRTLRPDTQILDPIGLSPTVSFLACACSIGTPELIKYLVEEHKGKLNFECLQRAIMFNRDPAVANYVSRARTL